MGGPVTHVLDVETCTRSPSDEDRDDNVIHGLSKQCIAAFIVSLVTLNAGLAMGWMSPMSLVLESDQSPAGPLSDDQIGLVGPAAQYSMVIASLVMGTMANTCGRKRALYFASVLNLLSGTVLTRATTMTELIIGRVLAGFTTITGLIIGPMLLSEIVHSSIRGTLISVCTLQISVGCLLAFSLGNMLSYKTFNIICTVVPAVQFCLLFFIPESPLFLVSKKRVLEAEGSLFWYSGSNRSVAKAQLAEIVKSNESTESMGFVKVFQTHGTKKALLISLGLVFFQCTAGFAVLDNYCGLIFEKAGSPLKPGTSAVIVACIQIFFSLVSLSLVDYFGRKSLLYVSHIGSSISLAIFTVYLEVQARGYDVSHIQWLSLACLCSFIIFYNVGVASMAFIISNEVSPVEIKGVVSSLMGITTSLLTLACIQGYPLLNKYVGDYANFLFPAITNFIGVIFTWVVIPETKGKTLIEISAMMSAK